MMDYTPKEAPLIKKDCKDCNCKRRDMYQVSDHIYAHFPEENNDRPIILTSSTAPKPDDNKVLPNPPEKNNPKEDTNKTSFFGFGSDADAYDKLPINDTDKQNIRDIIDTLSSTGTLGLAFKKGYLQKKGQEVSHVHTLKFLGYIFCDPQLRQEMMEIQIVGVKWNGFVNGTGNALSKWDDEKELVKYIPGFAKALGLNKDQLMEFVNKRDWKGFLNYLVDAPINCPAASSDNRTSPSQ